MTRLEINCKKGWTDYMAYPYDIEDWLKEMRLEPLQEVWNFIKKIGRIL